MKKTRLILAALLSSASLALLSGCAGMRIEWNQTTSPRFFALEDRCRTQEAQIQAAAKGTQVSFVLADGLLENDEMVRRLDHQYQGAAGGSADLTQDQFDFLTKVLDDNALILSDAVANGDDWDDFIADQDRFVQYGRPLRNDYSVYANRARFIVWMNMRLKEDLARVGALSQSGQLDASQTSGARDFLQAVKGKALDDYTQNGGLDLTPTQIRELRQLLTNAYVALNPQTPVDGAPVAQGPIAGWNPPPQSPVWNSYGTYGGSSSYSGTSTSGTQYYNPGNQVYNPPPRRTADPTATPGVKPPTPTATPTKTPRPVDLNSLEGRRLNNYFPPAVGGLSLPGSQPPAAKPTHTPKPQAPTETPTPVPPAPSAPTATPVPPLPTATPMPAPPTSTPVPQAPPDQTSPDSAPTAVPTATPFTRPHRPSGGGDGGNGSHFQDRSNGVNPNNVQAPAAPAPTPVPAEPAAPDNPAPPAPQDTPTAVPDTGGSAPGT